MFNSLRNIDLRGAGAAIMNGFLGGLKAAWGGVKSFVGGIASWIKRNKGPISYDKKLLIPAGRAIMDGLNKGLVKNFENVKASVSDMNDQILDEFVNGDLVGQTNLQKSISYSNLDKANKVDNYKPESKTPVQLVFDINGRLFEAFVDDITDVQNKKIKLEASY